MYARSHGYSPMKSGGILFSKPSKELELLVNCFSESSEKPLPQSYVSDDVHVDVVDENGEELFCLLEFPFHEINFSFVVNVDRRWRRYF